MNFIKTLILLLFLGFSGIKFSQDTGICGNPYDGSLNCSNAVELCSFPFRYNYDSGSLGCEQGSNNSLWHSLYVTSNSLDLYIEDAGGTFLSVNVYGPFTNDMTLACNQINSSSATPIQYQVTQNNDISITLNSTGLYLIEVIENDCLGCLTFELIDGLTSCESSCPTNNCETPIELSCNFPENLYSPCEICGTSNELDFWYTLNANEGDLINIEEIGLNSAGDPYDFDYAIASLPEGMGTCSQELINNLVFNESNVSNIAYAFETSGVYVIRLFNLSDCPNIILNKICIPEPCETCIGSFAPIPGNKYLVGAWTKEENSIQSKTNYTDPELFIDFTLSSGYVTSAGPFTPAGAIIDGWQRIEEEVDIPLDAVDLKIRLTTNSNPVLFDDVRFFPFDASMKTFVYDPVNMRLAAELDERHYATFYEYDEEGKLVRIKKETEKGIMTIQETKSNSSKKLAQP